MDSVVEQPTTPLLSFPYRIISKEEALNDYNKLREKDASIINLSSIGNKACDFLFQKHREKTNIKGKLSHVEAWKQDKKGIIEFAKKLNDSHAKQGEKTPSMDKSLRAAIRFKYGSINQFRPMVAKYVYQRFKPKRVLDISAGWGNRLLAAMACDIDYIGIDSNKNLKGAYEKMYQMYPSQSNIQMIISNSEDVDFSTLKEYDMAFTSPPYYTLEEYEHMKKYATKEEFISEFFKPVIMNSYKHLKKGGHLVLNMPVDMKDEMVKFKIAKKINSIKMPIQNRFNDGIKRFEYIYWFKK